MDGEEEEEYVSPIDDVDEQVESVHPPPCHAPSRAPGPLCPIPCPVCQPCHLVLGHPLAHACNVGHGDETCRLGDQTSRRML